MSGKAGPYPFLLIAAGLILGSIGAGFAQDSPEHPIALRQAAVVALEPAAGQAVVRLPDGRLHLLSIGDVIPGTRATLQEVLPDRVVVEEVTEVEGEPPVRRQAWWFEATSDGASRLEYLERRPPDEEPVGEPRSETAEPGTR